MSIVTEPRKGLHLSLDLRMWMEKTVGLIGGSVHSLFSLVLNAAGHVYKAAPPSMYVHIERLGLRMWVAVKKQPKCRTVYYLV